MKSMRLLSVFVILTITLILPYTLYSQERGEIGLTVKAQLIPHVGISYAISDNIQTRFSTYLDISDGELVKSNMSSLGLLIGLSSDKSLSTYIGPDITYHGFLDELYVGIILGTRYSLHPRLNIFGEFTPGLGIGDGIESVTFLNTGIGIQFYFK